MRHQYQSALSALCTEAAAAGDMDALIDHRHLLVDLDPLSSRAVLSLMHVLVAAGDRPAALATARAPARRVRAELDADPDPTLLRFERELRRLASAEPPADLAPLDAPHVADLTLVRGRRAATRAADGRYWLNGG